MIREIQLAYLKSIDTHASPQWNNINEMLLLLIAISCPSFYDPIDCSLPGSSVQGIFQVPFPSPGDRPDPVIKPASPVLASRFFITEPATREDSSPKYVELKKSRMKFG